MSIDNHDPANQNPHEGLDVDNGQPGIDTIPGLLRSIKEVLVAHAQNLDGLTHGLAETLSTRAASANCASHHGPNQQALTNRP